jgi:hypothetical protein
MDPYKLVNPWLMGSRAAYRSPCLETCQATHSAFQCSTATNTHAHRVVKREHLRAVYITGYEVMNPVTIKAQTSGGHCR